MRYLISEKISPHRSIDSSGYLVCTDAILSRTGKQDYYKAEIFPQTNDWSTQIHVDRKLEDVMSPKALASFENKPVTIEHPDEDVSPENYREYTVGFARDIHQGKLPDGTDVMMGTLVITDQDAIEQIQNGEYEYLSCGYDCDFVGSESDMKQMNIRGNHIALCKTPRAGITRIQDSKPQLTEYRLNIKAPSSKIVNDVKGYLKKYDYNFVVVESKNALDMRSADIDVLSAVKTQVSRQYPEVTCEITSPLVTDSSRGQKIERNKVIIRRGYHNISEAADQFKDVYKIAMKNTSKMNVRLVLNTLETMYIDAYDDAQQEYERDIATTAVDHYNKAIALAVDFLAKRKENLTDKQAERMQSYIDAIKKLCDAIANNSVPSTFKKELTEILERYDDEAPVASEQTEHSINFSDDKDAEETSSEGETHDSMIYKKTKDAALADAKPKQMPGYADPSLAVKTTHNITKAALHLDFDYDIDNAIRLYENREFDRFCTTLDVIFHYLDLPINGDFGHITGSLGLNENDVNAVLKYSTLYLETLTDTYKKLCCSTTELGKGNSSNNEKKKETKETLGDKLIHDTDEKEFSKEIIALASKKLATFKKLIIAKIGTKFNVKIKDSVNDAPYVEYGTTEGVVAGPDNTLKLSSMTKSNITQLVNTYADIANYKTSGLAHSKTNDDKNFVLDNNVFNNLRLCYKELVRLKAGLFEACDQAIENKISVSELNYLLGADNADKGYAATLATLINDQKLKTKTNESVVKVASSQLTALLRDMVHTIDNKADRDFLRLISGTDTGSVYQIISSMATKAMEVASAARANGRNAPFYERADKAMAAQTVLIDGQAVLKTDIEDFQKAAANANALIQERGELRSGVSESTSFSSIAKPSATKMTEKEKAAAAATAEMSGITAKKKSSRKSGDSVTIVADSLSEAIKIYKAYKKSK